MTTTQINLETAAEKLSETLTPAIGWAITNYETYLHLVCNNCPVAIIEQDGNIQACDDDLHTYLMNEIAVIL